MGAGEGNIRDDGVEGGRPVVLQVVPALATGGVERGTIDIATALMESGARAVVASSGGPLMHQLGRSGAIHETLPLASKNPLVMRRNAGRLAELIEAYDVDIVHARSRAPAWSALWAARRTGRRFVTTFHAAYGLGNPLKRVYNSVMARGERVIAISHFIAEHLLANYEVDPAAVRVIHRGVDLDLFDPQRVSAERVIQLARRWRLPDGVPVVMLPGRLSRWKGHSLLIQAAALLKDETEFLCLLVGGDAGRDGYRRELEAEAAALGLAGRAIVLDDCDDMPAAYMLADVVVSASTRPEGFGRIVSEAQAMGRPVVAADHGGAPEQLLPDVTGFLVRPNDAAALAEGLHHALSLDGETREELAAAAIDHVHDHFSKEQMCAATLSLYRSLLADAPAVLPKEGYVGA